MVAAPAAARADATVNFETPALGTAARQIVNPYTASGLSFTAIGGSVSDAVVGVVKNSATSACVEPADANQKLGTGRQAFANGSIGLAAFPIKAQFASPLAPAPNGGYVRISVEFQTLAGSTLRVRLYDASGTQIGAPVTAVAGPNGGTCGYPGSQRARKTVTATVTSTVASVVMDTVEGGRVVVIDNFTAISPVVATPVGCADKTLVPIDAATAVRAETAIVCLTNAERAKMNIAPLTVDTRLQTSARGHSTDMVTHHFFDHIGSDGSNPQTRADRAGYPGWVGENISCGWDTYATPENVMSRWMNEAPDAMGHRPHRENILNPSYRHIGVGVAIGVAGPMCNQPRTSAYTQDFGTPR
jgi:uncharacterized protein YkwD